MSILLAFVGATLAGAFGWWLGAFIGPMSAYLVSTIASGVGFYCGRKFARELLD